MKRFKKTIMLYNGKPEDPKSEDIAVTALINMDHVHAVLPGPKPGTLSVIMSNKTRYNLKDDADSLLSEGNRND